MRGAVGQAAGASERRTGSSCYRCGGGGMPGSSTGCGAVKSSQTGSTATPGTQLLRGRTRGHTVLGRVQGQSAAITGSQKGEIVRM